MSVPWVLLLGLAMIIADAPRPLAQGDGAQWRAAGYLKAANPDEDDHLSAGDAVTGVGLAISKDGTRWR